MSWQGEYSRRNHLNKFGIFDDPAPAAYVDTNLVGTGKVSRAAIIGQQGGLWAASPGYSVSIMREDVLMAIRFAKKEGVPSSHAECPTTRKRGSGKARAEPCFAAARGITSSELRGLTTPFTFL